MQKIISKTQSKNVKTPAVVKRIMHIIDHNIYVKV